MAMHVRYYSEFTDCYSNKYRVEILQESQTAFVPKEITLSADGEPAIIDWKSIDKYDVIFSSALTLVIASDTDRQFIDLYHVELGMIRCDIYRNEQLYWSGLMDSELYEEPYSYATDYDVSVTFSDFGALNRLKWDKRGTMSVMDVVNECLERCGLNYNNIIKHISTSREGVTSANLLDSDYIICDNFYDDNDALTLYEVLEGVLRPYALQIVQKAGNVYIYDLNALCTINPVAVEWDDCNAILSADKVFNNVTIKYKANEDATLLDASVSYDSVIDGEDSSFLYAMGETRELGSGLIWHLSDTINVDAFKLTLSNKGDAFIINQNARFFKIKPWISGSEKTGVAWYVKTINIRDEDVYLTPVHSVYQNQCDTLLELIDKPFVCSINEASEGYHRVVSSESGLYYRNDLLVDPRIKLSLSVEIAFDGRYNIFENEEKQNADVVSWANIVYLPVKILLCDAEGNVKYHYRNKIDNPYNNSGFDSKSGWYIGDCGWDSAVLAYYDTAERENKCGCTAFSTNRIVIGWYSAAMPALYDKLGGSELIPLPPEPGWIKIQIGTRIQAVDYKGKKSGNNNNYALWNASEYDAWIRWFLITNVSLKVLQHNTEYSPSDEVVKAWVNTHAREELTLDTIVGTLKNPSPCAKGQIFDAKLGILSSYTRNGITARLEDLLIGTIYSHYHSRHNKLTGSVVLLDSFNTYSDNNMSGKFALLSEAQRLYSGVSDITIIEINPDEYNGENV